MGTSGSEAEPGACPAQAYCTGKSTVAASHAVKPKVRFMSRLLAPRILKAGFRLHRFRPGQLIRRRHRRRERLAKRQPHRSDLLLLGDDDLLGQPPQLLIVAM